MNNYKPPSIKTGEEKTKISLALTGDTIQELRIITTTIIAGDILTTVVFTLHTILVGIILILEIGGV